MLGKSVIGTAYSESADFLTEETGFPVPYTLRGIEAHEYAWSEGQFWAEPSHDATVVVLREAYANQELRARKARADRPSYASVTARNKWARPWNAGMLRSGRYEDSKEAPSSRCFIWNLCGISLLVGVKAAGRLW